MVRSLGPAMPRGARHDRRMAGREPAGSTCSEPLMNFLNYMCITSCFHELTQIRHHPQPWSRNVRSPLFLTMPGLYLLVALASNSGKAQTGRLPREQHTALRPTSISATLR